MFNKKLKKGTVLENVGWLISGNIIRMIIQLIIGIISARYLGPSNYGTLNYVSAYISLFSIICELGLTITIVNELVKNSKKQEEIIGTAIVLRLIVGGLSVAILQILVFFIDKGENVIQIITFIRSIGLIFEAFNSINGWYQYNLQSKYPVFIELLSYIISSIYKIYILYMKKNIYWFAGASVVDIVCIGLSYLFYYKMHTENSLKFSRKSAIQLLKGGIPFIAGGIMIFIYSQTDRIMIKKMIDNANVGFYSCAATISTLIGFIPQAIMNSGKSIIMEMKSLQKEEIYIERLSQMISCVFWLMVLYSICIIITGKWFIIIMFGKEFYPAKIALNILVWSSGFSYIGTIRNIWLICENKNRYAIFFSSIGAFINIILNFIFIPKYSIAGAAFATVITQICTTFLIPFTFNPTKMFGKIVLRAIFMRDIKKEDFQKIKEKIFRRIR